MYRLQNLRRNPRKTNGIKPTHSNNRQHHYIGRFAPSPTGPLHLGSLYTALASYLQAHANNGQWLLRIDDLDTPRNQPGAVDHILQTLDKFSLHWDGEIMYESHYPNTYLQALEKLNQQELLYPCTCSRKQLIRYHDQHPEAPLYPGFCREQNHDTEQAHALRVKTFSETIGFTDALQGKIIQNLNQEHGDFIVKRRDKIIAYQLSAVVGEQQQKITEVVRGYDLLDSTPRQIYLQQQLGFSTPKYMHVPLIIDKKGVKLSKQAFAEAVNSDQVSHTLVDLLVKLKQSPPVDLIASTPDDILAWAIANWQPETLKHYRAITL